MNNNLQSNQQQNRDDAQNLLRLADKKLTGNEVEKTQVSVVVINCGHKPAGNFSLESLSKQHFLDFETIVVNGDDDRQCAMDISKNSPSANVFHCPEQVSVSQARNLASKAALGKYLLFLDSDAWLHKTTLGKLVEVLESQEEAGIAGPIILNEDRSLKSIGMNIDEFGQPFANNEPFKADVDYIDTAFFVPSSVFMIERQLFVSLNGFDELYVHGLEDADLCWRAKLMGRQTIVNPWSIAYHNPQEQIVSNRYLQRRNGLRMLIKNYGAFRAITRSLGFVKTSVVQSFKSLLFLKPRQFTEYWKALFWNLRMLPDSIRQRRHVQRRRRLDDKSVLLNMRTNDADTPDNQTSDRAA
ncbi:MAG TPA: glycosyltransferase [Actinobacteria bacterium]|nr:glycosyltransferase [Actinomycetota bacterium]